MTPPILDIAALCCHFPIRNVFGVRTGWARTLDGVSLTLRRGEVLGIVGESGCGKSTLGKTIVGIHRPTSGGVLFEGNEIARLSPAAGRAARRNLQYCYQDPGASLDPRWKIGASLQEPLIVHTRMSARERAARVAETLLTVGLPERHLDLYPHEISGGQQRRVGLARILMLRPSLVILDEPTSGLDVSVQATVLMLLRDLRATFGLTYMFVSHDLGVVRLICDRIAVMYLGRVVEIGDAARVFGDPRHPYTQLLLASVPEIGGRRVTDNFSLEGEPPNPGHPTTGCRFRARCPRADSRCADIEPDLAALAEGHAVACHHAAHAR